MQAPMLKLDPYQTFALRLGDVPARAACEGYDCRPYVVQHVTDSLGEAIKAFGGEPDALVEVREASPEAKDYELAPRAAPSAEAFRVLDRLAEAVRAMALPEGVALKLDPRIFRVTRLGTRDKFTGCVLKLTGPRLETRTYLVSTEQDR